MWVVKDTEKIRIFWVRARSNLSDLYDFNKSYVSSTSLVAITLIQTFC